MYGIVLILTKYSNTHLKGSFEKQETQSSDTQISYFAINHIFPRNALNTRIK